MDLSFLFTPMGMFLYFILPAGFSLYISKQKGYNLLAGFLVSFLFGWLGVFLLAMGWITITDGKAKREDVKPRSSLW